MLSEKLNGPRRSSAKLAVHVDRPVSGHETNLLKCFPVFNPGKRDQTRTGNHSYIRLRRIAHIDQQQLTTVIQQCTELLNGNASHA